jgi:hypothetical protein
MDMTYIGPRYLLMVSDMISPLTKAATNEF